MTTNSAGRYFRAGTSGQFKPGYYSHRWGRVRPELKYDEVTYTSTNEEGFGATLAVEPARERAYGNYGFYEDNDPRNDPDFYDDEGGSNFPSPDDPADYEDGPVQGEMFKQEPGFANSLMANIESRSRTMTLLGIAARDQERNFGPALVSSSLTPDSFGMLKHIKEVEQGKNKKTVNWGRNEPPRPTEAEGDMRPGYEGGDRIGLHQEGASEFPSHMLESNQVEDHLVDPTVSGLVEFKPHEVSAGKQFVRDQWVRSRGKKNKARPSRQLNRQQELFPEETNP